jgi:NADPH-dependent 2,4-dienoyl-CoA reductase/sulfur reductase-like enzyme
MIVEELGKNQVEFLPETKPVAIEKGKGYRLKLITNNGELDADLILMGVGTRRNTTLAESMGLVMGESGAIKVDFRQKTSREGVYAVGDCCDAFHKVAGKWVYFPLGDVANKQGRVAGQNAGGYPAEFPGIVGAQAFKVFNLEVAATGLTEEEALRSATRQRESCSAASVLAKKGPFNGSAPCRSLSGRVCPSTRSVIWTSRMRLPSAVPGMPSTLRPNPSGGRCNFYIRGPGEARRGIRGSAGREVGTVTVRRIKIGLEGE